MEGHKKGAFTLSSKTRQLLSNIENKFQHELVSEVIPFLRTSVDNTSGGFINYYENDRHVIRNDVKRVYHQGRMLWLFSYIDNNYVSEKYFRDGAKQGFEFLNRHCVDADYRWFMEVSREGVLQRDYYDIFSSIYSLLGLSEFIRIDSRKETVNLAVSTAYKILDVITSPSYQSEGHQPYIELMDSYREPGTKRLGHTIHFLYALTTFLRNHKHAGLEQVARFLVRKILRSFIQNDTSLCFEFLKSDYTPFPKKDHLNLSYYRYVDGFHSIEAAWYCMYEAQRVGSSKMMDEAIELGRATLGKCWLKKDGAEGLVRYYNPDAEDPMENAKILPPYVMKEVFIFLLLALQYKPDETWVLQWLDKLYQYCYIDNDLSWPTHDTLHHPRGLLHGLEIIKQIKVV